MSLERAHCGTGLLVKPSPRHFGSKQIPFCNAMWSMCVRSSSVREFSQNIAKSSSSTKRGGHVVAKSLRSAKLWERAVLASTFSTTCHHPAGKNTVSPGCCTIVLAPSGSCLFPVSRNQPKASRSYSSSSSRSSPRMRLASSTHGGIAIHNLQPVSNVFHAAVWGWSCIGVPDLGGPMSNHAGGRGLNLEPVIDAMVSCEKHSGTLNCSSILVLSANKRVFRSGSNM
mmetsp:Transcript_91879/g.259515  ORF Transcript_91879/g.259515 Transcript_91879/m.259515 type:complete len:227 (-) Transcript_91879:546-1226(-)